MIRTAIKQVGSKAIIFTTIFVVVGSVGFAATQKVVILANPVWASPFIPSRQG